MSRGVPQAGPVVVPPAPTTALSLHINARVCSKQEFLLVHSRSRFAAFFNPKPFGVDGDAAIPQIVEDVQEDAAADTESVATRDVAPADEMAAAALQDVMAALVSDLMFDEDIADVRALLLALCVNPNHRTHARVSSVCRRLMKNPLALCPSSANCVRRQLRPVRPNQGTRKQTPKRAAGCECCARRKGGGEKG